MKVELDLGDTEFPVKMLIETLCIAQTRIGKSGYDIHRAGNDISRLQSLIDQLNKYLNEQPGVIDNKKYVRDNRGIIWLLVHDGGMATRITENYMSNIESCGINWLKNTYGPLEYL